ncbi:MAG: hydrogenase maturation nickel metallochaperone HypA [Myxococcota bacterium]
MHEYAILQSLLDRVRVEAARVGATSVRRLHLRVGEQSGVEMDLLRTAWDVLGRQGLCAEAEMDVTAVPAVWVCPTCDTEIPRGAVLRCASCRTPARMRSGDEIILERLEMEVPDV